MVASNLLADSALPLDTTSHRGNAAEWPLLILGPGGDYARRYVAVGTAIRREGVVATRELEVAPGIADASHLSPRTGVRALLKTLAERFEAIAVEVFSVRTDDHAATVAVKLPQSATKVAPRGASPIEVTETADESHAEATQGAAHRSRYPQEDGLLAHDAGDRRRAARQQGHGFRARRGADREGRVAARCEQGSLFNGLA
jgi:hypothetical protein